MIKIKMYLKFYLTCFLRFLLKFYFLFPIKNKRITFLSFDGKYNCNPKCISDALENSSYERIWMYKNKNDFPNECTFKMAKYISLKGFYYLITSNFVVINSSLRNFIPFRKKTIIINTWHGGGAFKVIDFNRNFKSNKFFNRNLSYFISSSEAFTNCMKEDFKIEENKFLNFGMPRNDIFFSDFEKHNFIIDKIRNELELQNKKILLYAPTFRGYHKYGCFESSLNFTSIIDTLQERFGGEWVVLCRAHHTFEDYFKKAGNFIDVSFLPDIQPLLLLADCLISDFSSCIYDYALTKKMGFLFIPDLKELIAKSSFKSLPSSWGFPVTTNNDELRQSIYSYNEMTSLKRINAYLKSLKIYDNGTSTMHIIDFIKEQEMK